MVAAANTAVFTPDIAEVPFAKIAAWHEIDRVCPNTGHQDNNIYHYAQNAAKNNFTAKGAPLLIAFADFDRLQKETQDKIASGEIKLVGKYPADRKKLEGLIDLHGKPAGENTVVSLEAYVFNAEYVNTEFNLDEQGHGRNGEAVNCNNSKVEWNDIHIALSESADPATDE